VLSVYLVLLNEDAVCSASFLDHLLAARHHTHKLQIANYITLLQIRV
jgi:hypothetical protein